MNQTTTIARRLLGASLKAALPFALIGALTACGSSNPGSTAQTCIADDECALGTVCILMSNECQAVSCDFCIAGQICYTDDSGDKSCSKPECTNNSQCDGEESCVEGACIEASCTEKADCADDQVCDTFSGLCKQPPATCSTNFDCTAGRVCLADGSCAPGCATDTDCDDVMDYCNADSNLCEPGCRTDASCAADQVCNDSRQCECDESKCEQGFVCDTNANACVELAVTSCDEVTCGPDQFCDPDNNFQCMDRPPGCSTIQGDPNACPPGQRCNQVTNMCEIASCPNITEADCTATPDTPVLNTDFCACVQCVEDAQCGAGAGCDLNGNCIAGCEVCDPNVANGACGDAAPFCPNGCCVECTVNSECSGGQVCLRDGKCGAPPSCTDDPDICPAGTMCMNGACQSTGGGGACDPTDTTSCRADQMCLPDPITGMNTCQGGGGGSVPIGEACTTTADCAQTGLLPVVCSEVPLLGKVCFVEL